MYPRVYSRFSIRDVTFNYSNNLDIIKNYSCIGKTRFHHWVTHTCLSLTSTLIVIQEGAFVRDKDVVKALFLSGQQRNLFFSRKLIYLQLSLQGDQI